MTAGLGVAHSELSSADAKAMHGVQLWTVLPDASRNIAPMFEHFGDLPDFDHAGMKVRLFIGQYLGQSSPATVFSEMVGAEIEVAADSTHQVQLATRFENGLMLISGDLNVEGENLAVGDISYHAIGISSLQISSIGGAKFLLLGGVPFKEEIIMWWNFIGRTHEEIQAMRNDWENHSPRFAPFSDQIGGRIPAPAMPNLHLQARGNSRDAT
jgi:redox-sensitive bicupin YhaK (pirin superfamily)